MQFISNNIILVIPPSNGPPSNGIVRIACFPETWRVLGLFHNEWSKGCAIIKVT
jgi:hypothetical protein